MSGSKPIPPEKKTPDDKGTASTVRSDKQSGRVAFDARGNAVWEWSLSTGIFGRDVGTERLKKLESPDLKIADDASQRAPASGASPVPRSPGPASKSIGGDPYNTAATGQGANRGRGSKPTDLRRLSEWIKRQRELQKKDE